MEARSFGSGLLNFGLQISIKLGMRTLFIWLYCIDVSSQMAVIN